MNKSYSGRIESSVIDCFNGETGEENLANLWYPIFEKRMGALQSYAGVSIMDDWMEYPYWDYTKLVLRRRSNNISMDLQSALLYARAFIDDFDDIYIITDTRVAAQMLKNGQQELLEALAKTDDINREKVEVIVPYDL